MKKLIYVIAILFCSASAQSQSVKPIARRVSEEKQIVGAFPQSALFKTQTQSLGKRPDLASQWSKGLLLELDAAAIHALRSNSFDQVELTFPLPEGGTIQLELVRGRVFSPEFSVRLASKPGDPVSADMGLHYWGIVKDQPGTLACISIFEGEVMGMIQTDSDKYIVAALEKDLSKTHIVYRERDLKVPNSFDCGTDLLEEIESSEEGSDDRSIGPDNCVRMYMEADYTIFQNKGTVQNVINYVNGFFSQVALLYANESVNVVLHELKVWNIVDPYTGPSSNDYLNQFRTTLNGVFNGDLAHLVGFTGGGGIAYLDVLCGGTYRVAYSGINTSYSNVPTYSWTVMVVAHEIGHNLGSKHTHACAWNGNNTAIDGCGPAAGYNEGCNAALPNGGGTIMSYCHLISGVGINFNLGFGPQPGDRMRSEVYNASCLNSCGGGGGCSYGTVNSENFEAGWGIWTDGGTDCARINNATYAKSVPFSIQLRDNTSTSQMTMINQNWTNYSEITVTFSYITVSFDNSNEDFWLQLSTNNGSAYTTVGDWNFGTNFSNGVRGTGTVVIPGPFAMNTRLRFRADASDDDDQVYIDDVVITGCSSGASFQGLSPEDRSGHQDEDLTSTGIEAIRISPNPAEDQLTIRYQIDTDASVQLMLIDLTGRAIFQNNYQVRAGEQQIQLDLSKLPNGVYAVQLVGKDQSFSQKVIVQR